MYSLIKYKQISFLAMPGTTVISNRLPTTDTTKEGSSNIDPAIMTRVLDLDPVAVAHPKFILEPHYRPCIIQIMPRDRYSNNPQ